MSTRLLKNEMGYLNVHEHSEGGLLKCEHSAELNG